MRSRAQNLRKVLPVIPELLAPAGGLEALKAAICAGADAVYLGAASFGARAAVGFSPDELKEAIRFAHFHDRRIYVTVNTLVKDSEWNDLRASLTMLRDMKADAVLIQDLGVLNLCREEFPELTLHASTQMSLHTPSGIRWAAGQGISRVVLNREATLDDIRAAVNTGIEIEVFAHGALCVSVSGQCALSASLGERSGNRGRCGQPCRLAYSYRGEEKAWLSPADLCTLPVLSRLADAGVSSLKLEGRLKRPEYVYIVTDIYRRALDRLSQGGSLSGENDMQALRQIFCRGRFTQGYAGGQQDAGILNPDHTAHEGLQIGRIDQAARRGNAILGYFKPTMTLHDQDGLTVSEDKCIYTGPDVPAGQTATLRLHRQVSAGTAVLRTESAQQLEDARSMFSPEALKQLRVPFSAFLRAEAGQPAVLELTARGQTVRISGPIAQAAEHHPLSETTFRQAMSKTGDAPFYLESVDIHVTNAYLSSAQLNAMRRDGLQALEDAVILSNESKRSRPVCCTVQAPATAYSAVSGQYYVRTDRAEEIPALLASGADRVLLTLRDTTEDVLARLDPEACSSGSVILQLPPLADDAAVHKMADLAERMGLSIAADNAGQLGLSPHIILTAEGIPVFNAHTEESLSRQGVQSAVLSPELSGKEIAAMPEPHLERIISVYGRQRLMLLNHCPERVSRGLTAGHENCRLCESGSGLSGQGLTDRKGLLLPLIPYRTDRGCVVRLYSGKPVSLLSYMPVLRERPLSFLLSFTDEPTEQRLRILKVFRNGSACEIDGIPGKYLTGVL